MDDSNRMKKVLVTGGAGFIGSHTVDSLLKENIPVRVLDNLSSGHRSNLPDSHPLLEFIEGDITHNRTVKDVMQDVVKDENKAYGQATPTFSLISVQCRLILNDQQLRIKT